MQTHYSIVINAEPQQVFYWLDDTEREMQWIPNLVENENLQVTENRIGSTFRQVYSEHGRHIKMRGVVTAYEPNRRLACELSGDSFDLLVDYRLEDLGGQTRLTQDTTIQFKGLFSRLGGILMAPFMKRATVKQLAESFGKLKDLAEAGDQGRN